MVKAIAVASLLGLAACGSGASNSHPKDEPATSAEASSPATSSSASAASSSSAGSVTKLSAPPLPSSNPVSCGALECRQLDEPAQALAFVLASNPRVLAVGEAHAPKGASARTATARFTRELLPLLRGRASDLVLELLVAPDSCKAAAEAEKLQAPVVDPQAETNQAEFVALRDEAARAGIEPHLLEPSCKDYEATVREGSNSISFMLVLIEALTEDRATLLLDKNEKQGRSEFVLTYGGAMHNDVAPPAATEPYAFGPALSKRAGGAYVELDLIVPEFIKDTESWRALPWYAQYKKAKSGKVTLYRTAPSSFTLVFARGS
ncbi:MAG: hypothetical protein U0271_08335 [Polyangiaceae bacterium]